MIYGVLITGATPGGMFETMLFELLAVNTFCIKKADDNTELGTDSSNFFSCHNELT